MDRRIFAFSLSTSQNIKKGDSIFTTDGNPIGRILSKSPTFHDDYDEFEYTGKYHYEVECTEDTFDKIDKGIIKLDLEDYTVHSSNTLWTLKEH